VSPKQQVFLMTAIFSAIGISVSIAIIANGGGFSGPGPSIFNPPSNSDLWKVGEKINQGRMLNYSLTSITPHSSLIDAKILLNFTKAVNNYWEVDFRIYNKTMVKNSVVLLSKDYLLPKGYIREQFRPYFGPIESSIFAVRDIAREPKYLVNGAIWDTITVGAQSIPIKITGKQMMETKAGIFDCFILSYKIGSKTSKIWITHSLPLPVKAEVYDSDDKLEYKFELTKTNI
jgi:hypothetical protein